MRQKKSFEQDMVWKVVSGVARIVALPFKRWLPGLFSRPTNTQAIFDSWKEVLALKNQGDIEHLKSALVQADKTLDHGLKLMVKGETMGERLKFAKDKFSHAAYQQAWEGHKVRNRLVHEIDHAISQEELLGAIRDIEGALEDLGLLR